jgi:hypothetical protein
MGMQAILYCAMTLMLFLSCCILYNIQNKWIFCSASTKNNYHWRLSLALQNAEIPKARKESLKQKGPKADADIQFDGSLSRKKFMHMTFLTVEIYLMHYHLRS